METKIYQLSSLEKIRSVEEIPAEISSTKTLLKGEVFSYQQVFVSDCYYELYIDVDSKIKEYIHLYVVKNAVMDFPTYDGCTDEDYITKQPGLMPDILQPIEEQNHVVRHCKDYTNIWVEVKLPEDIQPGHYSVTINYTVWPHHFTVPKEEEIHTASKTLDIEVLDAAMPKQDMVVTQWLHADCIAGAHNVAIYSEEHWELIEKYMLEAREQGINTIFTPIITPPLDTKEGTKRPNVQLVKITKENDKYYFDFTLLKRWIDVAKKVGMEYFETSHLFSQWGMAYTATIYVTENGKETTPFTWYVSYDDPAYKEFLTQLWCELTKFFEQEGIKDKCFIHISDEPRGQHVANYKYAYSVVKPCISDMTNLDAVSDLEFYQEGLLSIAVPCTSKISPFLEYKPEKMWTYYCCSQFTDVSNRFLAMPSYRNKVIGLQLYMNDIQGFLHWGFNFYYSELSLYEINPYLTTSGDGNFPSGDPFSVYPGKNGPIPSLRAKVFREAIQEVQLLKLLESFIGKDKVLEIIKEEAKMDITFSEYPQNASFYINLNERVKELIKNFTEMS